MNTNKIKLLLTTTALGLFASSIIFAKPIEAQYYSAETNNPVIVVDKKVRPINTEVFYDNILSTEKVFVEGDEVEFSIKVSNKGNVNLTDIKLVDYLPKYLTLTFFPGDKNIEKNTIEAKIDNLNPGESKEFVIRSRISALPTSNLANNLLQITNRACASTKVVNDCDNAKYFVAMSTSPSTGTDDFVVKTIATLSILSISIGLRKIVRGY